MAQENNQNAQQSVGELRQIRLDKLSALQSEGNDPFVITKYDVTHHSQEIKDNYSSLEGKTVTVAGRMMSKRIMGKASFCHIQDLQGTIQVLLHLPDSLYLLHTLYILSTFNATDDRLHIKAEATESPQCALSLDYCSQAYRRW